MSPVHTGSSPRRRVSVALGDDVRIDVIIDGVGPGIVLLPSLGRDSEDYGEVAQGLAAHGFTVLRPQPRGLGASVGPMHGITLADLASDVAGVIRNLVGARAIVFGHAFGNWVARMTASEYPGLVAGVVVAAAAAKTYPADLTENIRRIADPATPPTLRLDLLRRTFFASGSNPRSWLDGWHADVRDSQFAAARATPQERWWSAGAAPILELHADQDPFMPAANRSDLAHELGSRVISVVIPGASHALVPEQPDRVVEAVSAWARYLPTLFIETKGQSIDI
jgi:pimeloyl-ACP methyl ester carboxylesterase